MAHPNTSKRRRLRPDLSAHVVVSDTHAPYHDPYCLDLVCKVISDIQPVAIHHLGDLIDFHQISSHERNPLCRMTTSEEIGSAAEVVDALTAAKPKSATFDLTEGNHEMRWDKFLARRVPEVDDLLPNLADYLCLRDRGVRWHPFWAPYRVGKLWLRHGNRISPHAAYTARLESESAGAPILIGHTHRMGWSAKTQWSGIIGGWENGCLCRIDPKIHAYTKGPPNWQQGFSVVWTEKSGEFHVCQSLILGKNRQVRCMVGNHQWHLGR